MVRLKEIQAGLSANPLVMQLPIPPLIYRPPPSLSLHIRKGGCSPAAPSFLAQKGLQSKQHSNTYLCAAVPVPANPHPLFLAGLHTTNPTTASKPSSRLASGIYCSVTLNTFATFFRRCALPLRHAPSCRIMLHMLSQLTLPSNHSNNNLARWISS